MSAYDQQFFANHLAGALSSARVVVPLLSELVKFSSVVDVGCGTGAWLSVLSEQGVTDFHGFDGEWAVKAGLLVPCERFTVTDLAIPPAAPLPRRFDVALSLEVAEHLPEASAERFVEFLTVLAPVVVFSAAIPNQGGTDHVNEQWPDYWAKKFDKRGYACVDAVRPRVWAIAEVKWWYAQNTLIYVDRRRLADHAALKALANGGPPDGHPLRLVHPECFALANRKPGLKALMREAPAAARRTLKKRFRPG